MTEVLLTAISFVLIILLGIIIRGLRMLPANAGDICKKLMMTFTMPAAIIINFTRSDNITGIFIWILLLGFLVNVFMLAVATVITRNRPDPERALYMMCLPSMNIGAFGIPFISTFLPPVGTVAASVFDAGNAIVCTGGGYAFTSAYLGGGNRLDPLDFLKKLVTSVPLMTYVVMFALSLAGIRLPAAAITLLQPTANANTFLAMLMLGLLFHMEFKRDYIVDIVKILVFRHLFSIPASLLAYFLLPFDLPIRQALVFAIMCPVSAVATMYTGLCGGDEGKASAANSISIILSVLEMMLLLVLMKL